MKTLEAMAAGKNVVSTTAGARGLPVQHLRELLIADSADAFADAILTLIHDTSLRNRLQQEGRALAARYECKYLAGQLLEQVKKMNP
jgi:glycosyltransferase involved in cell wall biosynthesis